MSIEPTTNVELGDFLEKLAAAVSVAHRQLDSAHHARLMNQLDVAGDDGSRALKTEKIRYGNQVIEFPLLLAATTDRLDMQRVEMEFETEYRLNGEQIVAGTGSGAANNMKVKAIFELNNGEEGVLKMRDRFVDLFVAKLGENS